MMMPALEEIILLTPPSRSAIDYHSDFSIAREIVKCASTVNYLYFLLSGSNYLWLESIENITLISLWAVARTAIL
jgi:hypothetical protein